MTNPAERNGPHLGRIALAMGLVSEAQLAEAERLHEEGGRRRGLGAIFLEKGFLTRPQVMTILLEQRRQEQEAPPAPPTRRLDVTRVERRETKAEPRPAPHEPTASDLEVARAAVRIQLLSQAQVDEGLELLRASPLPLPLSVVLQERGWLDAEELEILYRALEQAHEKEEAPRAPFLVEVLSGEDEGRLFPVVDYRASVVGRGITATVKLSDPLVSREQCLLEVDGGQVWLTHLKGLNPTYVNERAIGPRVRVGAEDLVRVGNTVFSVTPMDERRAGVPACGPAAAEASDEKGVRVEAKGITKSVRSRDTGKELLLLDGVNVVVNPGEFVVILGPSGSGKSTLMDALNGRRRATAGRVYYDGIDLYKGFDVFKTCMGYVPQRDIVHTSLTVRRALYYTAKLRLPPMTPEEEIDRLIGSILAQMGLEGKANTRIGSLSGGQIKRVSLAVELVSSPSILFLDEATSGLDAGTERKMMSLFRQVADQGKTVVCITHNIENIHQADLVVVLYRGTLVYYGPPDGLAAHFDVPGVADLYDRLEAGDPASWHKAYLESDLCATYVKNRLERKEGRPVSSGNMSNVIREARVRQDQKQRVRAKTPFQAALMNIQLSGGQQFVYLALRYLETTVGDVRNLALLLLQAPLIALVIRSVFTDTHLLMFLMTVSAMWFGCLNACKEIVKESEIYKRERMVNLKILPYVLSKLLLLVTLSSLQCLALLLIVHARGNLEGALWIQYLTLLNVSVGGLLLGLLISAVVDSTDKALAIVPLVLIPQIVYTVYPAIGLAMSAVNKAIAQAVIMAYWAFDALRMSEIRDVVRPYGVDLTRPIAWANGVLVAMEVVLFAATLVALRRKDRAIVE